MSEALDMNQQDPYAIPLEDFDVSQPELFENNNFWAYFERMRKEDPVHYCKNSNFGPYWSITKFEDILYVDKHHDLFSSDASITLPDRQEDFKTTSFIAMDPPKHDGQRAAVQGVVAPANLAQMESIIRERVCTILDSLPLDEEFNWVDLVSIELTTQMLATIFNFPFEDRYKLTYWSDMATSGELAGGPTPEPVRRAALLECLEYFTRLRNERANQPPSADLISMLAHGDTTKNLDPMEYLGNLILLIVGGNDTTRNSATGGVLFLHENPNEFQKLKNNHALVPGMVSEIIRYQTPLAYMRRTATVDTEIRGKKIKAGDKVVMWYVSGNRDEEAIENPNDFIIDRARPRHHLSFGFGIHRCMGNRMAEMQLRVLWEEILNRFSKIEVVGEPVRVLSSFVKGYSELPVKLHAL